jgi:phosphoserine phosphatase
MQSFARSRRAISSFSFGHAASFTTSTNYLQSTGGIAFINRTLKQGVLDVWTSADAVCFDVDSTVIKEEGIDALADHCGAGTAVAKWTQK